MLEACWRGPNFPSSLLEVGARYGPIRLESFSKIPLRACFRLWHCGKNHKEKALRRRGKSCALESDDPSGSFIKMWPNRRFVLLPERPLCRVRPSIILRVCHSCFHTVSKNCKQLTSTMNAIIIMTQDNAVYEPSLELLSLSQQEAGFPHPKDFHFHPSKERALLLPEEHIRANINNLYVTERVCYEPFFSHRVFVKCISQRSAEYPTEPMSVAQYCILLHT